MYTTEESKLIIAYQYSVDCHSQEHINLNRITSDALTLCVKLDKELQEEFTSPISLTAQVFLYLSFL